ncbi:MAG: (E)-4-hydroxy-3-methylbut-2-enyl-diphosphate synthase [Bacteroidia bacterium]|nr:(E)-4-hydroxy-3-methylbut-2-enyl-diphosphate synthase [Bacteroidia bacterium]
MDFQRRLTRVVNIGGVPLGGTYPVRVQTMTNLPTADIDGQVAQILRAVEAGAEYVRITTPTLKDVEYLQQIKDKLREGVPAFAGMTSAAFAVREGVPAFAGMTSASRGIIPLIADVHFSPKVAIAAARVAAKVRINPGNFLRTPDTRHPIPDTTSYLDRLHAIMRPLLEVCKEHGTALRIGTNHGSLSERILDQYGDTPEGMVEATLEAVRICKAENFHDIVLSLKSSNVKVMVESTRLLVQRMDAEGMDYPLHLGVTEAGEGEDGRLKSAIGIGSLLVDGIGDTIRVSLTEDPEFEIPVAYSILQASRARITRNEYISCPGCGRTTFNLQQAVKKVKEATAHLTGLKIAVMGCIVNGPGEMADADYGYVGAGMGKVHIYKGKEVVAKNVAEDEAVGKLLEFIN